MNKQKRIILLCLVILGFVYSCANRTQKTTGRNCSVNKSHILQSLLRSTECFDIYEDTELLQKIETAIYEYCVVKDDRFTIINSKNEWMAKGLPEPLYEKMTQDIKVINHYLDTVSGPKLDFVGCWKKSRKAYLAKNNNSKF